MFRLTAGGYIDTSTGSKTHGEFNIPSEKLDLFNFDNDLGTTLKSVKEKVKGSSSDTELCNEVLSFFHSACDPKKDSCSKANQQSFQVTIDEVCKVVDTKTKLKFKSMAEEFDGFVVGSSKCEFYLLTQYHLEKLYRCISNISSRSFQLNAKRSH